MTLRTMIISTALIGIAQTASPAIIYDNGGTVDNGDDSWYSDPDVGSFGIILADEFSLGAPDIVRSIVTHGSYYKAGTPPVADNFSISFFTDKDGLATGAGGVPSDIAFAVSSVTVVSRVDTGFVDNGGTTIFKYELDLVIPQSLSADTTIWISIVNDTTGGVDPDDNWAMTVDIRPRYMAFDGGNGWISSGGRESIFQLNNTFAVPQPNTALLLGMGLVAMSSSRRRSRVRVA